MAATIGRRLPVPPASRESLERGQSVLDLCKQGDLKAIRRMFGINPNILNTKDSEGHGVSYFAAESKSLELCRFIYEKDADLFSSETREGRDSFRKALHMGNQGLINWFLHVDSTHLFQKDENGATPILWASREGLQDAVILILDKESELIFDRDSAGNTPFLIACSLGNLSLAQVLYARDPLVVDSRDTSNQTALLKALQARNGLEVVKWLLSDVGDVVALEEEFEAFVMIMHRLDPRVVKATFLACYASFLVPHVARIKMNIKDKDVLERVKKVKKDRPKGFTFIEQKQRLEGPALIDYYNRTIGDIPTVTKPCHSLIKLFDGLTEEDYLANMNLGKKEDFDTLEEARAQKKADRVLFIAFFRAVIDEKPDRSIPLEQENFYYTHLKRIMKHLAVFLEKSENKDERFTYLKMITEASGSCYTNFSTVLHNIYARITNDPSFAEASMQEDLPSHRFESEMIAFYRRKVAARASASFDNQDAHVMNAIQKFFDEEGIPYLGETAAFNEDQLFPALKSIREELLAVQGSLEELNDQELYEQTKQFFIERFNQEVNSIGFIHEGLKQFLLKNLNGSNSRQFLGFLTDWLQDKGILVDRLLKFEEETGTYKVKSEGIHEMLKKLPRFIEL